MSRNLVVFCLLLGTFGIHSSVDETSVSPNEIPNCLPNMRQNVQPALEARDCSDYYNAGRRKNGVYLIRPDEFKECFHVYCEMEKYGGGWTVIQRRGNYGDPDSNFYKDWVSYKNGFGSLELEFWLGNDRISAISKQGKYKLQVDLMDTNWKLYNFTYGLFQVEGELELYKLTIGEYSGDNSSDILLHDNGSRFSTMDRNNGIPNTLNCAMQYYGAWWYSGCGFAHLNSMKKSPKGDILFRIFKPVNTVLVYSQLMIK